MANRRADYVGCEFGGMIVVRLVSERTIRKNATRRELARTWLVRCLACGHECTRQQWNLRKRGCGRCLARRTKKEPREVLLGALYSHKRKGALPYELFVQLVLGDCHYCGVRPYRVRTYRGFALAVNGIDRIDSAKDYEPENCVTCCWDCNRAKGAMHREAFLSWLERAAAHQAKLATARAKEAGLRASPARSTR